MKNKRGISPVVSVVLLIVVGISAIVIIAAIFMGNLQQRFKSTGCENVELSINGASDNTCIYTNDAGEIFVSVDVMQSDKAVNLSGIQFVFQNKEGNSDFYIKRDVIEANYRKILYFYYPVGGFKPVRVSAAGIVRTGNTETICSAKSEIVELKNCSFDITSSYDEKVRSPLIGLAVPLGLSGKAVYNAYAVIDVHPVDLYSGRRCSVNDDCPFVTSYTGICDRGACAYKSGMTPPPPPTETSITCTSDSDCNKTCSYVYVENAVSYAENPVLKNPKWNDGKWATMSRLGNSVYLESRYSKSANSDTEKMLWRVKYAIYSGFGALTPIQKNITIPAYCWSAPGNLTFRVYYDKANYVFNFSCSSSTGIRYFDSYKGSSDFPLFYEEGVYYCQYGKCDLTTKSCYILEI